MSFEAESNSELTVIVPAYQLHFRFPVQNKIHKQNILLNTWTAILGSIAGPCDFLLARSDEFLKVWDSESLLIQWQEFIQILSSSDNRSLTHLNELFQSVDHKDKNFSSMYPLVSKLYSIAVIQPLNTAEVERIFSQLP